MGFSSDLVDMVLVKCGRHCCLCHKFCGIKIELHHIKQKADGGEDTYENCIPLCLDCHAEVKSYNPRHPKGRSFSEKELKEHRNNWYAKVEKSLGVLSTPESRTVDSKIYDRLKVELPYDCLTFVKGNDFGGGFFVEYLRPLKDFIYKSENPENEFIDSDLEGCRANLIDVIDSFLELVAKYTSPTGLSDCSIVRIPLDWEEDNPEVYHKAKKEINDAADLVWNTYCDLVRVAKSKLL